MAKKLTQTDTVVAGETIAQGLRRRKTYITSAEVREILHKSKATLSRWIQNRKIPGVIRIGNENMFEPVIMANWLESRQINAGAPSD
jgi:hypothetical protein